MSEPQLAASGDSADPSAASSDGTVGLVPAAPEAARKLRAMSSSTDDLPLFGGTMPLQDIMIPGGSGIFGIPEIVLAAYRNAELALASSDPGCGLNWSLLAGIGKIESNHAANGRTDANGTTLGVIYGPALDGTLPGNEVLKSGDGGFVRAIGPMQFLPGTWSEYASDGLGNGHPDPNNVFDAALAAGKYLCSGGLDLRDPQQQLRAVLRYNNSMAYASEVLSWANAYRTGGVPTQVTISPDLVPPGTMPEGAGSQMTAADSKVTAAPGPATQPPVSSNDKPAPTPTQVIINIPGLPPIPCGIFCPAPQQTNPCDPATTPAPAQNQDPNNPLAQFLRWAPGALAGQTSSSTPLKPGDPGAADPKDPDAQQQPACTPPQTPAQPQSAPGAPKVQQAPAPDPATQPAQPAAPANTPPPAPPAAPPPAPTVAPPPPGIQLPFGIVIPLPPAPR
ncbi:lytic transglycosylase domain-containing protein [Nocardia miyunensis]|uniref:lytic transglycosylase domain-containing protein n=1 Tax=Nocardia miyunensis TaxID=282684 RepID=UPI001FE02486|nr:lytic murein transglycosylase [Nocardia miyunensis]